MAPKDGAEIKNADGVQLFSNELQEQCKAQGFFKAALAKENLLDKVA